MKAIITLLVTCLMSPVFAQMDDISTQTTTSSTSSEEETVTDDTTYESDSAFSDTETSLEEDEPALSGSATATDADESELSGTATGTTGTDSATMAPASPATPAAPATETTTTRTYREETIAEDDRRPGGFFVEPGIVGSSQETDLNAGIGSDVDGTSEAFGADLKLGGHIMEGFFLGANGRYQRAQFEGTALEDTDADVWNWGPVAGFQAPFAGARIYGTYVVDGSYNPESGNRGVDLRFEEPYGWRGGIGFRLSNVSLNLEYEDLTYNNTEVESVGDFAIGTAEEAEFSQRGYALMLSFPIEL